ncbi:bifunctional DNA primase/polymerase [Leuconostoc mesenteroides]|uniref:bifunctional DNA primase/polymerase n=1 Tax=Leuconostoc mesenteroides TaxID=1245 RepID=UPI000E08FCE2|nr:bifunctional DNA primase/polymerase [Leuconostoc mesenteroides]MDN6491830.1 bifunctional DNA primase/polymerase [Leuconostoc sp.]RDF92556.1 DNA primase [Leuconostoc mesenteroides subsp. mesenteroides]WMS39101.1 bifunctional DNA primase/polymerase [Leuconostoc mesenteroides]
MSEDTKKPLNTNLQANVQEVSNNFISSDFIIKSHELIEQGFKVYLLAQGTNTPYKGSRGHLDATNNVRQLTEMFLKYKTNSNIGISLVDTGVAVLDIDKHSTNGFQSLIQSGHTLNLDNEVWEMTPRSGVHIYFKIPDGVRADELKHNLMAGVELLTDKVTVAPSIKLVDGIEAEYKHFGGDISECSVMPDWLVKMASNVPKSGDKQKKRVPRYSIDQRINMMINGFDVGERNNQIMSFAGWLLSIRNIDPNLVYELVQKINSYSAVPLPDKEVNTIFRSAYNREVKRASMGGR